MKLNTPKEEKTSVISLAFQGILTLAIFYSIALSAPLIGFPPLDALAYSMMAFICLFAGALAIRLLSDTVLRKKLGAPEPVIKGLIVVMAILVYFGGGYAIFLASQAF